MFGAGQREPIVGAAGCRSSELPLRSGVNFFMTLYALTAHTREKQKVDKQRFYAQSHIGLFVVSVASRRQMIHGSLSQSGPDGTTSCLDWKAGRPSWRRDSDGINPVMQQSSAQRQRMRSFG